MARKKSLKIWQIWHVEFARRASLRSDGCYQIIARLVREGKNYWVAVNTAADPPMRASFAVFDDYGREVEPERRGSRCCRTMFAQMFSKHAYRRTSPPERWKDRTMTDVENTPGPASKASERLKKFIQKQMRMSDIYQPVMIKTLLGNAGRATIREVASAFLAHDESQIEYYEHITKQMPGKDLMNHGILERQGQHYALSPEFADSPILTGQS
jgi:hypothetical protein